MSSELIVHVVDTGNQLSINKKMLKWYNQEALRVFNECVEHFAPLMAKTRETALARLLVRVVDRVPPYTIDA